MTVELLFDPEKGPGFDDTPVSVHARRTELSVVHRSTCWYRAAQDREQIDKAARRSQEQRMFPFRPHAGTRPTTVTALNPNQPEAYETRREEPDPQPL
eukprot:5088293-Amphidinium_carterae.2